MGRIYLAAESFQLIVMNSRSSPKHATYPAIFPASIMLLPTTAFAFGSDILTINSPAAIFRSRAVP